MIIIPKMNMKVVITIMMMLKVCRIAWATEMYQMTVIRTNKKEKKDTCPSGDYKFQFYKSMFTGVAYVDAVNQSCK